MPISLRTLKTAITPSRTALVLGAGASVPSGAPTGGDLAGRLWKTFEHSEPGSDDLTDTASALVRKYGRRAIVEEIVIALTPLKPTGGLLGLPMFGWSEVFTTNFDQLVEKAYKQRGMATTVYRSNYDFTTKETAQGTKIYKIHGCLTQDDALGHKASMILTEGDYEKFAKYRQALFAALQSALLTGDVLIIGQRLKDRHLSNLIREVLASKFEGAPGTIYVLVYDKDDLRAPLLEDKGARIAFGGIDEFVHAMADGFEPSSAVSPPESSDLPVHLVGSAIEVPVAAKASPNVQRMFKGGPATYADIQTGATFPREIDLTERLTGGQSLVVAITGAAGVGKTTFARQIMLALADAGFGAWEHKSDFAFDYRAWATQEAQLRAAGKRGVLLLDECTHNLRGTNALVDHLSATKEPALCLVLTANSAQWAPRIKSPNIFAHGTPIELSRLEDSELYSLIGLLEANNDIAALVEKSFKQQRRPKQFEVLRQKCSSDMFVCLDNIFANQSLDTILLQEFEDLSAASQDVYRYVAALEAVGMKVHRQLLIRMLYVEVMQVAAVLNRLKGIVDEYDIRPKEGIYGWSTRHIVIARKITEYKFSSFDEVAGLFDTIIDNINPTEPIELQSVRAICDTEFGIGRIGDPKTRQRLYRRLVAMAPAERIPWHRLIRELLDEGSLDETEYVLRDAEGSVGADAPTARYKVRLLVRRSEITPSISDSDRKALLRKAYELALQNTGRFRWDKFSYRMLCEVALKLVHKGESSYVFDEAITKMRNAADHILDPDMDHQIQQYERIRAQL